MREHGVEEPLGLSDEPLGRIVLRVGEPQMDELL